MLEELSDIALLLDKELLCEVELLIESLEALDENSSDELLDELSTAIEDDCSTTLLTETLN